MSVPRSAAALCLTGAMLLGGSTAVQANHAAASAPRPDELATAEVARCAATATPNRPDPDTWPTPNYEGIAMDTESGKVVAVDYDGRTWTFNVCRNTWRPAARLAVSSFITDARLVYASGRDRVLAYSQGAFARYSVERNRWTGFGPANRRVGRAGVYGLAHDRESKRILVLGGAATVWSYSLVTERWRRLHDGNAALAPRGWLDQPVMTFDPVRRQLVAFRIGARVTWTFDVETRRWTRHRSRPPELSVGWAPSGNELTFDVGADRAIAFSDGLLAAYSPERARWRPIEIPEGPLYRGPAALPTGALARIGGSLVYDPVNRRVLVVGGSVRTRAAGERTWQEPHDVLAYRYRTDRWRRLVLPSR